MGDGAQSTAKIRATWLHYAPFVGAAVLLSVWGSFFPSTVITGSGYEIYLTWFGMYLAIAAAVLGGASYLAARWSGRARPDLVAILATVSGTLVLAIPGLTAPGLWMVVAAAIAIRPPSPTAYPARLGFGTVLAFVLPWVLPLPALTMAAPLVGIWLADRMMTRAISGQENQPTGVKGVAAGALVGGMSGAVLGIVAGIAIAFALGAIASAGSDPVPVDETSGDLGLAMLGIIFWAGIIGTGLGLFTGPFFARSKRKKQSAGRS